MAKKSEVGNLFFKPSGNFTIPGQQKGQAVFLGSFIITEGLAKEIFGEDEDANDKSENDDDEDSIIISGRNITVDR